MNNEELDKKINEILSIEKEMKDSNLNVDPLKSETSAIRYSRLMTSIPSVISINELIDYHRFIVDLYGDAISEQKKEYEFKAEALKRMREELATMSEDIKKRVKREMESELESKLERCSPEAKLEIMVALNPFFKF